MKAAVLNKPGEIKIKELPEPEIKENEVLIRVKAVGVCGSDVHYYQTGGAGEYRVTSPIILGHEAAGEVMKVGQKVKKIKKGDKVAIEPGVPCLKCDFCRTGHYNLCPDVVFMATPPHNGAFCEYVKVPEDFAYPLPDNISYEAAALIEPFAVGLYAVERAKLSLGQAVLINGCGPIGLMCIQAAKVAGAGKILAVDIEEKRLSYAKKYGATDIIKAGESNAVERIKNQTANQGCDVVFETSGAEQGIKSALKFIRRGGKLIAVGVTSKTEIQFPYLYLIDNEIDILPVFRYVNMYPRAIQLLEKGLVDLQSMVTHRFPLEKTQEALDFAHDNKSEAIKVVVNL